MLRKLLLGLIALVMITSLVLADEAKGKFKSWAKETLTLTIKGKDVEYKVSEDAKVLNGDKEVKGKARAQLFDIITDKDDVTVIYDKVDDKITVKEVKVKK